MKMKDIVAACGLEAAVMPDPEIEVSGVYTSDLLSDVMAHCAEGALLVTVQNHKNSIAVCTLVCSPGVIVVHGRPIPEDMLASAKQEGVAILVAKEDQFTVSCRLGKLLGIPKA
jgi:serine kinase of HPr protein (carbohydrate metabolism regulator)